MYCSKQGLEAIDIKIMLDPGHAGSYYNASPSVVGYYESNMTWSLALKLKRCLEERGFEVGLTRQSKDEDPELTERGRRAYGYDLFLSLHSNAAASEIPDAPWMISFSEDTKTSLDERSREISEVLGEVISRVMGISSPFYYTKGVDFDRDGNGYVDDEYYGVLFGAKSVGVPGVIAEHGFHTHPATARWLMNEENLEALANAEADALAEYFGIKKEDEAMSEAEKAAFDELAGTVKELERKLASETLRYDTVEACPLWGRETVKRLVDSGVLKGRDGGKLDLSDDAVRILVYLDRAGKI